VAVLTLTPEMFGHRLCLPQVESSVVYGHINTGFIYLYLQISNIILY
jgi:hypothetical protein